MRIKGTVENLDYESTKAFFENRAERYDEVYPYSVTMYQDNHKDITVKRNAEEIHTIYPLLELNSASRVLDVACGIGRWADAIQEPIDLYCGVDFSKELIEIAKQRNIHNNFQYYVAAMQNIADILQEEAIAQFNVVLIVGALMYLNDSDVEVLLKQVEQLCGEDAIICVREPIATENRLTLKDFFSEELNANYNAIYRTQDELQRMFERNLVDKGFVLEKVSPLFAEGNLNNRKETMQYYFILRRKKKNN